MQQTFILSISILFSIALSCQSVMAADQYFDYSMALFKQGKYEESLKYIEYSIQKQKRADNLYHKGMCLRYLNRRKESHDILNEIYQRFPDSPQVRQGMIITKTSTSGLTNAQAAQARNNAKSTPASNASEKLNIDSRTMPAMPPLNDPPAADVVRAQNPNKDNSSGTTYWNSEEVREYILRAESQLHRAENVLKIAEQSAKSHLRSKNFGESDAAYQSYVNRSNNELRRVVEPYYSYGNRAGDIYNSWVNLGNELDRKRTERRAF